MLPGDLGRSGYPRHETAYLAQPDMLVLGLQQMTAEITGATALAAFQDHAPLLPVGTRASVYRTQAV